MRRPGPDRLLLVALALTALVSACRETPAPPPARPPAAGTSQAPAPADELATANALLLRGSWAEAAFAPLRQAAERVGDEERRFWAGLGWARAEYGLGHPDAVRSELALLRGLAQGSQKEAWIAIGAASSRSPRCPARRAPQNPLRLFAACQGDGADSVSSLRSGEGNLGGSPAALPPPPAGADAALPRPGPALRALPPGLRGALRAYPGLPSAVCPDRGLSLPRLRHLSPTAWRGPTARRVATTS